MGRFVDITTVKASPSAAPHFCVSKVSPDCIATSFFHAKSGSVPIFIAWFLSLSLSVFLSTTSLAAPSFVGEFCNANSESATCKAGPIECSYCHMSPPALNDYGQDFKESLEAQPGYDPTSREQFFGAAMIVVSGLDSDGDGFSNEEELELITSPSVADQPTGTNPPPGNAFKRSDELLFLRVSAAICGKKASFQQIQKFKQSANKASALNQHIDQCLQSDFWLKQALKRLADPKIRPLKSIGIDGTIVLADYNWDYNLFVHALSEERDARELLLADYHVDGSGKKVTGPIGFQLIPRVGQIGGEGPEIVIGTGQPLQANKRAGMLTTQWFLMSNTMFSEMPRVTAAQAYRAYLGKDISLSEGLHPVVGEPQDPDVTAPSCAACHSTLDPLSYPFTRYQGIVTDIGVLTNRAGTYDPNRSNYPETGELNGNEFKDLRAFAEWAANSEGFEKTMTSMFWEYFYSEQPKTPEQTALFEKARIAFKSKNYSANALIKTLVLSDLFGGAK